MIPDLGNTSQKGYVLGDSVYWAPLDWLDMTLGAHDYTKRGWSQQGRVPHEALGKREFRRLATSA